MQSREIATTIAVSRTWRYLLLATQYGGQQIRKFRTTNGEAVKDFFDPAIGTKH
jgi:hypothetical protein